MLVSYAVHPRVVTRAPTCALERRAVPIGTENVRDLRLLEGSARSPDHPARSEARDDRALRHPLRRETLNRGDDGLLGGVGLDVKTVSRNTVSVRNRSDALASRLLLGKSDANTRAVHDLTVCPCERYGATRVRDALLGRVVPNGHLASRTVGRVNRRAFGHRRALDEPSDELVVSEPLRVGSDEDACSMSAYRGVCRDEARTLGDRSVRVHADVELPTSNFDALTPGPRLDR